ncbi:MAG: molybdenum cofactor guanylyltransferase [Bacteroidetes bacterium]|nr:molybdenum cofactor guanylyltransferase [Bacteroidota bacterium]
MTAIILTGGRSKRFGEDKAMYLHKGTTFLHRAIDVAMEVVSRVVVIGDKEYDLRDDIDQFPDNVTGKGPLAGIVTGLKQSTTERNLVLACDYPNLNSKFLEWIIESAGEDEIVVVKEKDQLHPLIGCYSRSLLEKLNDLLLEEKLKMHLLVDQLQATILTVDETVSSYSKDLLVNVNDPRDIQT